MNLVLALGFLVSGGILMYAGVKGETLSQVMTTLKNKGNGLGTVNTSNLGAGKGAVSNKNPKTSSGATGPGKSGAGNIQ